MRLPPYGAFVAVAILIGCGEDEERAESVRRQVVEALAQGDRATALDALGELREVQPDTPEALLELTRLLVLAGEAPQAAWLLEDGVRRLPERTDLRLALAQAALLVNDASRARAVLAQVPEDSEYHLHALLTRGHAELQLGDLEAALATFEEAERRHPGRARARVVRIATLLKERRIEEARALLEEAKRSEELRDGREAIRRLEVALYGIDVSEGRTEAAIAGLRALVDENPAEVHAWRTLISTLLRVGRAGDAEELLTAALDSDPAPNDLYPMLALVQASLGRADEAEALLRMFADRSQSPSAYVAFAQFYMSREDPEGVLAVYREATDAFPGEATLRRLYTEALVSAGRLEEARGELAHFREAAPKDPHAQYLQARIELAEGDAAAAAARLEKWIPQIDGGATQFWLGRALEAMGDEEGAARRYGLAMARAPSDPAPYFARIALAERRGDWRGVVSDAHRLVQRSPARFAAWRALVTALVNLRDAGQAEPLATRAVEIFPDRPEPQILLAAALRVRGRHSEALARLDEAADRFGTTPEIEAERALTQGVSGQLELALATAQAAIAESPDSAALFQVLAALLFRAGRAEAGARATDRALELDPADPRPLRTRAEFRVASGRLDGARSDCVRYLELRPADPAVHHLLAAVHEKAGRAELAIASYRRAAELDEKAFAPRNNLAVLLAGGGDLDGALAAAQEAYAIAGDNPYVMDTLGELYLRKGRVDRAISLLEDAHAAAPELPDAQLHLALAYREAGERDRARALLADLRSRSGENVKLRARVDEALESL